MKVSLILATLGRKEEVMLFLKSLIDQKNKNFELIIVDQNREDYVFNLYLNYKNKFEIKYIRSTERGLSRARNKGLKLVTGQVVAFPDDDCEYPSNIIGDIISIFNSNPQFDIITCKTIDKKLKVESSVNWKKASVNINGANVSNVAISHSIFIKYKSISDIYFDELLGVGAKFGSSEETDMLLGLLRHGYFGKYIYSDALYVYHPQKVQSIEQVYSYALGAGALIKKQIIARKNYNYIISVFLDIYLKPLIHILISFIKFDLVKVDYFNKIWRGKIKGFLEYRIN